jgi:hypothetical protein
MTTFAFTASVTGLDLNSPEQLDRLYTDDFMLQPSAVDGVTSIDVEIDADSGEAALQTFLDHVAGAGVRVTRVLEDLVNVPEIAERLNVNRETVRTWVSGSRGPADFPSHRMVIGNQKLWTWNAVHAWALMNCRVTEGETEPLDDSCVDWVNGLIATATAEPKPSPVIVVVERSWSGGIWKRQDHPRRYPVPGPSSYVARSGGQWSFGEGRMEQVRV